MGISKNQELQNLNVIFPNYSPLFTYNKKSPTNLSDFFVYKSIVYSSSSWLHLQSRLRSPYALSIFATYGQNLFSLIQGSGNAAFSRG